MKIGVALAQRGWPDLGQAWSFAQIAEFGVRAERLGFDSVWANDHFFIEHPGQERTAGPEPFTLLSYLAGRTERVALGTLVACALFRSPGQLAREAKTLAELSGGRLILGLGAGWHQPELDAFGYPSDRLVSRFEEYVQALRALLAGGRVEYDGRYVRLSDAEVAGSVAPPLWIAGLGPRMLAIAARYGDGWDYARPAGEFAELLATIRREEAAAGRPAGSVTASVGASVLLVAEPEARRLLADHPPMFGRVAVGAEGLRELVAERRAQGCGHLVLHFSGGVWSCYGPEQLDLAAEALGLAPA